MSIANTNQAVLIFQSTTYSKQFTVDEYGKTHTDRYINVLKDNLI